MNNIVSDDVTSDELAANKGFKDWISSLGIFDAVKNSFASNNVLALSAAAVLALSGASASAISDYSGTNYGTSQLTSSPNSACDSMTIISQSDPWIGGLIAGHIINMNTYDKSLSNFSTIYNSEGGNTTLSTTVAQIHPPGGSAWSVGDTAWNPTNEVQGNDVFNTSSTITHAGPNGWSITVAIDGSKFDTVVKNSSGAVVATSIPAGGLVLGDGTKLTQTNGNVSVMQPLNQGGFLTTGFNAGVVHWNNGVDTIDENISQGATGAVIFNGTAASLLVDEDTPLLALPCTTTLKAGVIGGSEDDEIRRNATQTAPLPAFDNSGGAAIESM